MCDRQWHWHQSLAQSSHIHTFNTRLHTHASFTYNQHALSEWKEPSTAFLATNDTYLLTSGDKLENCSPESAVHSAQLLLALYSCNLLSVYLHWRMTPDYNTQHLSTDCMKLGLCLYMHVIVWNSNMTSQSCTELDRTGIRMVMVMSICIAPIREISLRCSGIARIVKVYQFYLHSAHPAFMQAEWAIPAFAFPATAGTHLLTPEGWMAVRSSPGWNSKLQPPHYKSSTLPHSHLCTIGWRRRKTE